MINIRVAKFGRTRTVDVSESVLSDLKFFLGERIKGPIFPSNKSDRLSLSQINRIVADAAQRAGVGNPNPRLRHINPHIFRHSFTRNGRRQGVQWEILQKLLGHKSIKTTIDIYGEPSRSDVKEEYHKKIAETYG